MAQIELHEVDAAKDWVVGAGVADFDQDKEDESDDEKREMLKGKR